MSAHRTPGKNGILGLSFLGRDSSACLLVDGRIQAASQEERFTGLKGEPGFPLRAARFCLESLPPGRGIGRVVVACGEARKSRAAVRCSGIFRTPGSGPETVEFVEPHLCQIGASFFASSFRNAAFLYSDDLRGGAGGTVLAAAAGYAEAGTGKNRIEIVASRSWPHSPAFLSFVFSRYLGFGGTGGEYQLMGLAAYGRPSHKDKIRRLFGLSSDGMIDLDLSFFNPAEAVPYSGKFTALFGPARPGGSRFRISREGSRDGLADRKDRYHADLAASLQSVLSETTVAMVSALRGRGVKNLCLCGESGLNCVTNTAVVERIEKYGFGDVFIQPAAGPAGAAMGAALYGRDAGLEGRKSRKGPGAKIFRDAFLGKGWSTEEIGRAIGKSGYPFRKYGHRELVRRTCLELSRGRVAGWFQGRFEWGPRALGHRSILADPRNPEMKEIVNTKVKFRDQFRPFAPSLTRESVKEYFEDSRCLKTRLPGFMLCVLTARRSKRKIIPAVVHADGTSRIHSVDKRTDPLFHGLLAGFAKLTGVPVLLDTSFNLKSRPIVSSPEEALGMFGKSGLDFLVMDRFIVRKDGHG